MHSTHPSAYEKFSGGPSPQPPPPFFTPDSSTTTGIPVSSTNPYYTTDNSRSCTSHLESKNKDPWSTGLCDCFSDPRNCKLSLFFSQNNDNASVWRVSPRASLLVFIVCSEISFVVWWIWTGCITFWCPCVTFGQIAEIVDKGSSGNYDFAVINQL